MLSDVQRERLAARLRAGRAGAATPAAIPPRAAGDQPAPASFGQEQLWFIDKFAPGVASYNVACGLRLRGALDLAALTRAIDAFVARHEVLRTRLVTGAEDRPVQQIDPPVPSALPLVDLAGLDAEERVAELARAAGAEAARPFDLAAGPLFRRRLVRLAEDEHVLLTVLHHAVFDGWSFGVLMRELPALYEAEVSGTPSELAELPIQFADYAAWERERLAGAALEEMVSYWRGQLADLPLVQLPTDRPRPALESHRGAVARLELDPELIDGLRALATAENTTLHVALLTALQVLLARYTGQQDLVVGTPSANRGRAELASLIGFLVNTLPIRIDCSQDPSFRELLHRVHQTTLAGYAHQDLPLAKLVDALQIERDASRTPLFQITFAHAEVAAESIQRGGLTIEAFDGYPDPDNAKFDLALFVGTGAESSALLQYATDLFEPDTASRMLQHYRMLLTSAVADPDLTINQLPMLTEEELYAELVGWNPAEQPVPDSTLSRMFSEQVARTPDAAAVLFNGAVTSYAELQADVSRVTGWLAEQRVGPGDLVGIAMAPAARRLAVVLGVLAAGAGYVPLDPALPVDRLSFMAGDAGVRLIIADQPALHLLAHLDTPAHCLDADWGRLPTGAEPVEVDPSAVAYVMYTSGSTGWPKGVVLEHRQVVNFISWMIRQWQVDGHDRVLQYASLNFDVSVLDIFTALLSGATAVVADQETRLSPPRLTDLMRRTGVTLTCLPPAVISLLDADQLPALRVLIAGGEELTTVLALAWQRPGLRLVNGYGPTECTVISTWAVIDGSVLPPPIGRPTTNYRNYVLDAALNPVPVGVVGELHIGGAGVGRGYHNRPELTAQRFIEDPFSVDPADRLYKTGDLVKRLPDGQIHYLGRADGQVKLRGLRIELGEVERALLSHPAVTQAVVVLREDPASGPELVGYYRGDVSVGQLRDHLAGWLPAYMVPAKLTSVAGFQLNSSGKIDKSALPDPASDRPSAVEQVAPVGELESVLCEVYRRLLGQEQLSVETSFFDAGGNSLQAMRLLGAIRDELGVDLPITEVFLAPSVRQLGSRIAARGAGRDPAAEQPVLLELASSAADQSLVLIHAVGGTVYSYASLATELSARYQVRGLQSPTLVGQPRPARDVPELAASYLADLRAVQPVGPYRLGGWSMGGLLAYEMAKQAEREGETVELLVLLDAPFETGIDHSGPEELARYFVADALRTTGRPEASIEAVGVEEQLDRLAALLDSGGDGAVRAEVARRFEAFTRHRALMSGYRPDGQVQAHTLLIGADRSVNATALPHWQTLLPNASRHLLDADHYTLLRPENVRHIAELVEKAQIDAAS